jgi:hypothetical protein
MINSDQFDDRKLGRLGTLIENRVQADGPAPEADELWNWMQGDCDPGRADQIRSHLASNEELYELWQALRSEREAIPATAQYQQLEQAKPEISNPGTTSGSDAPDQAPDGFFSWLTSWPAGAFAYAALGIMILLVMLPQSGPPLSQHALWQHWHVPKTSADNIPDELSRIELQPFLVGIRSALQAIGEKPVDFENRVLPEDFPVCPDTESGCLHRQEQLFELGELTTVTVHKCVTGEAVAKPTALPELGDMLVTRPALSRLNTPMLDWIAAENTQREKICAAASTVLNRGLAAMEPATP